MTSIPWAAIRATPFSCSTRLFPKSTALIERRGPSYVLRDLGSLNGTYINGERVQGERELRHGDDIALGGTRARYDDEIGADRLPPAAYGSFSAPPQQGAAQQ